MRAYIFLVIVMILFSGNILVGRAINDLPPVTIAFIRCFLAFLILLPLGWGQIKRHQEIFRTEWKGIVAMGVTGVALFNILVYAALQFTTSTNVAIIETAMPVFTITLGLFFLREYLNKYQWIGIALSLAGALWVITQGSLTVLLSLSFNIGDLLMVGGVIVWALYSVFVKQHNHKYPPYGGLTLMLGLACMIQFPFAVWEWLMLKPNIWELPQVAGLLYLGIFPSVIALLLFNQAVADIGPSRASIFFNLLPVFTMIGAVTLLNEQVTFEQIAGAVLVIGGVLLTTRKTKTEKHPAPATSTQD
ncbi:DMT family transporter [Salsuginibacillus kocurii]|uniref:DMT family transporter n=1 Tax=Salsuginibacillus kocurii TaxID=427078 RepID=UPI0003807B26|nr:DMT family transporter [Salsuginibacillus kocurii]